MKNIISQLLLFIISILTSANVFGYSEVRINGLKYKIDTDTQEALLLGFPVGRIDTLNIPSKVSFEGVFYPVTKITGEGFYQSFGLTKVVIPNSIKEICPRPYTNPFDACPLTTIEVDNDNEWLCVEDNVLYNKEKTEMYCYPGAKIQETFDVPEGITFIGGFAFSRNPYLTEVHLPNSLKTIAPQVFNMCRGLKRVAIPSSVEKLGDGLFFDCISLEVVDIPENVISLGEAPFAGCDALNQIIIRGIITQSLSMCLCGIPESATIYVLPSEIDKYKKVFSGNVLPLEAYNPTAIHEISINQNANRDSVYSAWYDLSGRRVDSGLLPRGIYIRDGKKVVIK